MTNLTFRLSFVRIVSPVKGILLRIPALCRTENFPKLPSLPACDSWVGASKTVRQCRGSEDLTSGE